MSAYPSFWVDGPDVVLVLDDVEEDKLKSLHRKVKAEAASVLDMDEGDFKIVLSIELDEKGGAA